MASDVPQARTGVREFTEMAYEGAGLPIAVLSASMPLQIVLSLRALGYETHVFQPSEVALIEGGPCALVVVDAEGLDAPPLMRALRGFCRHESTPLLLVASGKAPAQRREALEAGASDMIERPLDPLELQVRARNLIDLGLARRESQRAASLLRMRMAEVEAAARERERETIHRLMLAAEFRDDQAADHLTRVAGCSIAIAEGLGLSEDEANDIALASTMHDIGKISVPDRVLLKAGPLDAEEQEEIRQHTVRGHMMLAGSPSQLLQLAAQIALSHHERWDGKGYPHRLAGEAIPLAGRIVAVADVFDALVSERAYKKGWPLEKARDHLIANAGSHFDPVCVDAFLSRWEDVVLLMRERPSTYKAA